MSQQQTVLRVQTNKPGNYNIPVFDFLDLYSSIPILINKSFAELGDIGKRNSDYSVGVLLPGSKKNNAFFESYFNVDASTLYFNPNARVPCWVLINDEPYFTGYLRLNKVSVLESKKEYDVTLFSTPAELYGSIGNNLLKDLNFNDSDYNFNHEFSLDNVTEGFTYPNFAIDGEKPVPYFYPVIHNGYLYTGDTVNFSGGTILSRTNLYTSTSPLGSYATLSDAYTAGVQQYRINSPTQGLYDNQLKPALSVWSLLQLIFKTYGYSIESDFFNTPWMKNLYLYGYFSSDATKFSWTIYEIQTLPLSGVEVFFVDIAGDVYCAVSKLGTGVPCYCDSDINITLNYDDGDGYGHSFDATIPYGTSGLTINSGGSTFLYGSSPQVPNGTTLKYLPKAVGDYVNYVDGDYVDFNLVIDPNIKQIDILSSIAKKFNLVLIPDPNNGYNIRIEPYDYFIGTGDIHDWSDKISYDKGFTVEPALNYIESEIFITDQEDNDEGNKLFKQSNNRIYGQNIYYGPTSFKSQQKKIDTIFSPEIIRKWDADATNNIGLPLAINYVGSNNQIQSGNDVKVNWIYKGVKTKPKLFWWLGSFNPFLDLVGETFNSSNYYKTYNAYIQNTSGSTYYQFDKLPVVSHTMPMGNPDSNKINNDSQCLLFNSELPTDEIGVQSFNTYTENDAFSTFYQGRVSNLYNPNTRVLTGKFNLSYADIKNLQPQDLIKINEQHFVVSKIEGFNLTNRDLTQVELVQFNNTPKTYVNRCFRYYYCDDPSRVFQFSTDFTNPNLLDSNYGWSIYYDHQIGSLGSPSSGFTSTFTYVANGITYYVPYTIYEVSCDADTTGILDWNDDCLHNEIYSNPYGPFQQNMPTFWSTSGTTGINLFADCDAFETARTTYGIALGSSTYFGGYCPSVPPVPFGSGLNSIGSYIKFQSDNKILIGVQGPTTFGNVTTFKGTTVGKYFRLNTDFTLDSSFTLNTTNAWAAVYDIEQQSTGKIIIAGIASSGTTSNNKGLNVVRLNTDGSLDTSFTRNYFNGTVWDVEVFSDDSMIVAGEFTYINPTGMTAPTGAIRYNGYVKLDSNGNIVNSFYSGGTGTGFESTTVVNSVEIQSGKMIFGGEFSTFNGTSCRRLERLNSNGTLDATFNSGGTGPSNAVYDVTVQSDGKILVTSSGGSYNGTSVGQFYRLNSDGSLDSTWNSGGAGLANAVIGPGYAGVAIQSDGKYLVQASAASATSLTYNGTTVGKGLIRLNTNGTLDTSWNNGGAGLICTSSPASTAQIGCVRINPTSLLPLAVGWGTASLFSITVKYNGTTVYGMYQFNSNGSLNTY